VCADINNKYLTYTSKHNACIIYMPFVQDLKYSVKIFQFNL